MQEQLGAEAQALLDLLSRGRTLGQAAEALHLSRRTADRRLAEARRALGVRSTAEAVAAVRGREAPRGAGALVGRDELLDSTVQLIAGDECLLLTGEAGVGKTALAITATTASGRPVHSGTARAALDWQDYGLLAGALDEPDLKGDVEAVARKVEELIGPDILLVDDAHLADGSTLAVLAALRGRVAVVAAARSGDPHEDHAVVTALVDAGYHRLHLNPLDDASALELAERLAPGRDPAERTRVVAEAAGLPLVLEVLLADDGGDAPHSGVAVDLQALSPAARSAAVLLAVAHSPWEINHGADELLTARVATRQQDGRLRIRHALIADAVLAAAGRDAVIAAHLWLAENASTDGEAALHWRGAGKRDEARAAAEAGAAAAESQADRGRLLLLAASCSDPDEATSLTIDAANSLVDAGLHADALAALDLLSRHELTTEQAATAALVRARAHWHLGDSPAAVAAAQQGADLVAGAGSDVEARLLVERVRCEVLSVGLSDEHDALLERATGILGDGPGRAALLNVAALLPYFRTGEGLREWQEGRAAAEREGDVDTLMRCANNVIMWNEASGDQQAALEQALDMIQRCRQLGLGSWELQFTTAAANLLYHRGRYEEALDLLERVDAGVLDERTRHQAAVVRAAILIDLGMIEAARAAVGPLPDPAQRDWMHDDGIFYLHSALELAAGRPRAALDVVDAFSEEARTESSMWTFLLPVRAWAEYDLGRPVTDHAEESLIPLVTALLVEAHGVARLAIDPIEAVGLLDEAAALGRQWSVGQGLRAEWGAAEAARLAGLEDAVPRLLAVEQSAADLRLEPLLVRIARSLRHAGVARSARRTADRSGLLTERERTVLDLVAAGSTYPEIARRLGVGRPTVRRLLESARLKLGAESRLAAVALVADR